MTAKPTPDHSPRPVDLATESVAGEEDPGASIEIGANEPPKAPPGSGEDVCSACGGSGRQAGGACALCQGTGRVSTGRG